MPAADRTATRDGPSAAGAPLLRAKLLMNRNIAIHFSAILDLKTSVGHLAGSFARCSDAQCAGHIEIAVKSATYDGRLDSGAAVEPAATCDLQGPSAFEFGFNRPFDDQRVTFGDIALERDVPPDRQGFVVRSPAGFVVIGPIDAVPEIWDIGGPCRLTVKETQIELRPLVRVLAGPRAGFFGGILGGLPASP